MRERLVYITVALVSFITILLELLQTRILSFIFWNDMVYLTVSMALLGFGISGSLVAVFASRISNKEVFLNRLLLSFGATIILALIGTCYLPLFWLLVGLKCLSISHTLFCQLLFCYAIYLLPFVCSGAILSIILSSSEYKITKLYAVDLISAGLACALFFLLLPSLGPEKLIGLMCVAIAVLSYFWCSPKYKWQRISTAIIALAGIGIVASGSLTIVTAPYKDFFHCKFKLNLQPEKTVWTPLCRIDVFGDDNQDMQYFPGLYPPHSYKIIFQDGSALTRILSKIAIEDISRRLKDQGIFTDKQIHFLVKKHAELMIIGTGGGMDIVDALAVGAKFVYSAEINPATFSLLKNNYADYVGHVFDDKRVQLVNSEGRSALRSLSRKFDIIILNGIDTFAALNAGAYVLSENYLYTVEAIQEMFEHLNKDGIIAINRWNTQPPRESLRLSSLACEALRRSGCQTIDQQLFIFGYPRSNSQKIFDHSKFGEQGWALSLFKRNPFTKDEVRTLANLAEQHGLKVLYWPKIFSPAQQADLESTYANRNSSDPDIALNAKYFGALITAYAEGKQDQFFAGYPYQVTPTTDDSPFFFEYPLKNKFGLPELRFMRQTAAGGALCVVIIESIVFSLLAIFWPLWKYQRAGIKIPNAHLLSIYFSTVGIGFMLIEISLMQKFVLFLGTPLYALPVVLASLLLSAGTGSGLVSLLNWPPRKVIVIFGTSLMIVLSIIIFGINTLFYSLLHLALWSRVLIALLAIFPLGLFMGAFFPSGLQMIGQYRSSFVPWAWGINGCTSVIGSILAIILAMSHGFTFSLLIGAFAYLLAIAAAYRFPEGDN